MMNTRSSSNLKPNPECKKMLRAGGSDNLAWLQAAQNTPQLAGAGTLIILLGGAGLADFRLRCAQAVLRHDFTPSDWSRVLIADGSKPLTASSKVLATPLDELPLPEQLRGRNAVSAVPLVRYASAVKFPNLCALGVSTPYAKLLLGSKKQLPLAFDATNLAANLWHWLGYIWGVNPEGNPLRKGIGFPDALLAQLLVARYWGGDLTPGLGSQASCPEAIWQAARWWSHLVPPAPDGQAVAKQTYLKARYLNPHKLVAIEG